MVVAAGFTKVLSFAFYFCFCFLKARYRKKCKICVVFVACFPLLLSHFIFIPFFLPLSPLPQHLWRNRRKSSLRLPKSPCILGLVAPPPYSLSLFPSLSLAFPINSDRCCFSSAAFLALTGLWGVSFIRRGLFPFNVVLSHSTQLSSFTFSLLLFSLCFPPFLSPSG